MFSALLLNVYFERDFTMSNVNLKLLSRMLYLLLYKYKPFPHREYMICRTWDAVNQSVENKISELDTKDLNLEYRKLFVYLKRLIL